MSPRIGPRIDAAFFSIAIASVSLILAETFIANQANYVYADVANLAVPPTVFAGLAIGNAIGMIPRIFALSLHAHLIVIAAATIAAFFGLAHFVSVGLLWISLPFLAFGAYMAKVFSEYEIKDLVWALGLSGALIYLALNPFYSVLGPHLALILGVLPLISAVLVRRHAWKWSLVIALAATALHFSGALAPRSIVERAVAGMRTAEKVRPPIMTPMIQTDLFLSKDKSTFVITTNGSRFAVVPKAKTVQSRLAGHGEPIPSYDVPYYLSRPKKVLVIGSAEGNNIVAALRHGAEEVTALDINPAVFKLMQNELREHSAGLYTHPKVRTVASEGRHFLETTTETYDLITLQGIQTGSASSLFNTALLESFLFTREALEVLWKRVAPGGMLFFDEYKTLHRVAGEDSLLSTVGFMAGLELPWENFDLQHVYYSYRQARSNPSSTRTFRAPREGLVLSKAPLGDSPSAIAEKLKNVELAVQPLPTERDPNPPSVISDDAPFFIQQAMRQWGLPLALLSLVLTATLVGLFLRYRKRRPARASMLALLVVGIAYILFVMSALGPITLVLGYPQAATPLLFTILYAFGLIGGLVALRASPRISSLSLLMLAGYMAAFPWILDALKSTLLSEPNIWLKGLAVTLVVAPIGILAELPYIALLKRFEGRRRGWAYTVENLGTLAGIPVGLWLQFGFGFSGAAIGAAAFYVLAGLIVFTTSRA